MDLHDAIQKAGQILDQERVQPTVGYAAITTDPVASALSNLVPPLTDRGTHFREVQEHPEKFQFKSLNFDLLCALLDQVSAPDRSAWLRSLLSRISNARSYRHRLGEVLKAGLWQRCSSELPLVAEFLVRRGDRQLFINALGEAAASPGLTLLLVQVEEMIALNFTLFTDEEYTQFPRAIASIRKTIAELEKRPKPSPLIESNTIYHVRHEVPGFCDSVLEGCRKARYFYVMGSLLPGMNLEVNQDKTAVRTFLGKLGFTQLLIQSLDEAERQYRMAATPFDLKNSMGHLRSFLENLHREASQSIAAFTSEAVVDRWGPATSYLREKGFLSQHEEVFVTSLYTLLSDESVHPLIAEREYARLFRCVAIEYGLMFLTTLDKKGVSLLAKP
jgi:hypothetical protein